MNVKGLKAGMTAVVATLLLMGAGAATVQQREVKRIFAAPPVASLKALKATVGKPFEAGYVFVGGKYVKPPYKVERYGTVIRINGIQVTGQVVPWNAFAKTQDGAHLREESAPAADGAGQDAPAAAAPSAVTAADDDDETTLDDLFSDEDEVIAPAGSPSAAAAPSAAAPSPKRRRAEYVFDGPFVMNDRARALLEKVNAVRSQIDRQLRAGGFVCFGSRYARVDGRPELAKDLLEKLPDLMKRQSEHEAFVRAARQAGFAYLPASLIDDFFTNRFDYLLLTERKKADAERKQWQKLMGN